MKEMEFDPWSSPEILLDPYPFYRRLRDAQPCHYVTDADVYVISRYDDVLGTLRAAETFVSGEGVGYPPGSFGSLVDSDPPQHTKLRRAVSRFFLPREIAALGARVEQIADRLLDEALDAGRVELMESVVEPLTIFVIAELLGVPGERREDFKRWSDGGFDYLGGAMDRAMLEPMAAAIAEGLAYFAGTIEERRAYPGHGATSSTPC